MIVGHVPAFQSYSNKYHIDWTLPFDQPNLLDIPFPDYWFPAEISRAAEVKNLAKGAKITHCQLDNDFNTAARWFMREAHERGLPRKFAQQTIDEVKQKMNRQSSGGYWCKRMGFVNKGQFIDSRYFDLAYKAQLVSQFIFEICPKVELRDEKRVLEGKTRTFNIAGAEHEVLCRKYFGNFMEWMNSHMSDIFALGNDMFHGGWHEMLSQFLPFPYSIDDDGPAFDLRIPAEAFWLFWKTAIEPTCTLDDFAEELWLQTTVKLVVDGYGNLFVQIGTNPSGWLLTALFNCWWNYVLTAVGWLKTTVHSDPETSYAEFRLNVRKIFMGDDRLVGVSEDYHPYFNAVNIHEVMKPWMPYEALHDEDVPPDKAYFLSKRSVWDTHYNKLVPTVITSRSVCSAMLDHAKLGFFGKLMKLLDLRIYAFYTPSIFDWLDNLCRHQLTHARKHFSRTQEFRVAKSRYWNDDQIRAFYCVKQPQLYDLRSEPDWDSFVSVNKHSPGLKNFQGVLEPNRALTQLFDDEQTAVSLSSEEKVSARCREREALETIPGHSQI